MRFGRKSLENPHLAESWYAVSGRVGVRGAI